MKVSVIIPVYNAAPYLDAALRSVFAQRGIELEVIAVDDGSTDGGGGILDSWAAECANFTVIHQKNAGQGVARNRGLDLATGDYVYFMDADDELCAPDALARLCGVMERDRLDLLFFDAETRMDPGVVSPERVIRPDYYRRKHDYDGVWKGAALYAAMMRHGEFCVSPPLMLLARPFLMSSGVRFPEERIFYEDNVFASHAVLKAKRASHRAWPLYARRIHEGSTVVSTPSLRHLRGYLTCLRDVESLLVEWRQDRGVCRALESRRAVYRRFVRHLMEDDPVLAQQGRAGLSEEDHHTLDDVLACPLSEKVMNGVRCLCERGPWFTMRRILCGRSR